MLENVPWSEMGTLTAFVVMFLWYSNKKDERIFAFCSQSLETVRELSTQVAANNTHLRYVTEKRNGNYSSFGRPADQTFNEPGRSGAHK